MYLSRLQFNLLSAKVQRVLHTPYHTHAAVMRGFPQGQIGGVLFRVEPVKNPTAQFADVLVQSRNFPDWTDLSLDFKSNLKLHSKEVSLHFEAGQIFRFRLRANPTVRQNKKRRALNGSDLQFTWLKRKGEEGGFQVQPFNVTIIDEGMWKAVKKVSDSDGRQKKQISVPGSDSESQSEQFDITKKEHLLQVQTVLFEGYLTVTEPDVFLETLTKGIGSAKGLGCGLLSLSKY